MARIEIITGQTNDAGSAVPRPRVLLLTHRVPFPPDRGDRIRAYHLLAELSKRARVTLAAVSDEPVTDAQRDALAKLAERAVVLHLDRWAMRRGAGIALLIGRPLTPGALYQPALARAIVDAHREVPFDTVVTFCSGMLGYTCELLGGRGARRAANALSRAARREPRPPERPLQSPRHILDLVDVDSAKWSRFAHRSRGPMRLVYGAEARRLRLAEAGGLVPFDALTVISDHERNTYRQTVSTAIDPIVAGNGVDLVRFSPAAQAVEHDRPPTIVFTGVLSYRPNIDAVAWFARRVMPRILAAVPDARFNIVGKSPTPQVLALGELPGVRVVGPVADTAPNLRAATVVVAPLRIAPGVQNKVLEAMACGRPVVCSAAAAAGIDATPGQHLRIADGEADTAKQVVALLHNPARRAAIGTAARQRVEQRYDWPARLAPLLGLILGPNHHLENPTADPRQTHAHADTL